MIVRCSQASSAEPFTGVCEPCPDGETAPSFATAADQCAAATGCAGAGSFQLEAGTCDDSVSRIRYVNTKCTHFLKRVHIRCIF